MKKVIFFDFDGVIIDSMSVRDEGFRMIAKKSTDSIEIIDNFVKYHRYNAGLSRFVKIKYLYENMLKKSISDEEIKFFADEFSLLMKSKLVNKNIIINETVEFIKKIYNTNILHIVSGSEQNELRFLCKELSLENYFKSIEGSPTHKNDLVKNILFKEKYDLKDCILIGDSINDYEAAKVNNIKFYGYNNINLVAKDDYINSFEKFKL